MHSSRCSTVDMGAWTAADGGWRRPRSGRRCRLCTRPDRRLGRAEDQVETPGENHRVDEEESQDAQVGDQGLEQGRFQPPGHDRDHERDEATFESGPMRQAPTPCPVPGGLARFPALEEAIEDVVPDQRNRRQDQRQHDGRLERGLEDERQCRADEDDGEYLVQDRLNHATDSRAHVPGVGRDGTRR